MPKVSFPGNIPDIYAGPDVYFSNTFNVSTLDDTLAVFSFPTAGMRVVLSGTNLDASEDSDSVVTKVSFETDDRVVYASITKAHYDFAHLYGTLALHGFDAFFMDLLRGDDTVTGSNDGEGLKGGAGRDTIDGRGGLDLIDGGKGNDRLTGGAGLDYFEFNARSGHDVITDFQARDNEAGRDWLFVFEVVPDYDVHKVKGGIEVELANSNASVILLGVTKSQFGDSDFQVYL